MKTIVTVSWITTILFFVIGVWPVALLINLPIAICITGIMREKNSKQAKQREIEQKEIDMVRKSNEILLHLIQNEHREDGDR